MNSENVTNLSIMYSGGLDSFIAWHYALKNGFTPDAIFVDMGQSNATKEWAAIQSLSDTDDFPLVKYLAMPELVPMFESRMSNQIIPSRNLFLATIGSMFNQRVWINALDGEQNGKEHDKSHRFFRDSTDLLSFTNSFFQESTVVETPFGHLSKAETIKWALNNGITKELLFKTNSCYNSNEDKCGECLTCYKRKIAFLVNGIDEKGYNQDPLISEYAKEVDVEIRSARRNEDYSRFTKKRIKEHFVYLQQDTI